MSEERELPTAAEVTSTDDSPELRRVEVADYTPDLLEVGDELVRRSDAEQAQKQAYENGLVTAVQAMQEFLELDVEKKEQLVEDLREKASVEKKDAEGDTE